MIQSSKSRSDISTYLEAQQNLDTLRFITCGSVDDGKSTLIGRMLYEAHLIYDDQISALKKESKNSSELDGELDFSLLLDGLTSEREQGITIDVAYRFFSTRLRKFIVADTPGHEEYTRNMVTGASTADLAVILIDARKGVLTQTRRHTMLCSLLGIRNFVVAVNKMDMVDFQERVFENISEDMRELSTSFKFSEISLIPISALKGDNVVEKSPNTRWYQGPTLFEYLSTVQVYSSESDVDFRFQVQLVNRPNQDFRGLAGVVYSGGARVGDAVTVMPSRVPATIEKLLLGEHSLIKAQSGQAITVVLKENIDVARGDLIVLSSNLCKVSDHFEVNLVWLDRDPGFVGRSFVMKIGTVTVTANITSLKYKVNINTYEHVPGRRLEVNDVARVTIKVNRPIPFENYSTNHSLGGFILIDRITCDTVAAGMIEFGLRRSGNIHPQEMMIDKQARSKLNGHASKVLWLTGISGSGKTSIANALEKRLYAEGIRTYILDGDNVRSGLNSDLGFTDADRIENVRRLTEVARMFVDAGFIVIVASISPFRSERLAARGLFESEEFYEIYVDTPLALAESRDPKGLYLKARRGEIPNFTAIGSTYEPPLDPDVRVETENKSIETVVDELMDWMETIIV